MDSNKETWEWFKYHASQRFQSFYLFMIIFGALLYIYPDCKFYNYQPRIAIACFGLSIIFLCIEFRNEKLISYAKNRLKKDKYFNFIKSDFYKKYWYIFRHEFLIKIIYFMAILISLHLLIDIWGRFVDYLFTNYCMGLIISIIIPILTLLGGLFYGNKKGKKDRHFL